MYYVGDTTNGANYTWYTATASTQGDNYSICPRGWKLPTKAQYDILVSKKTGNWNGGWTLANAFFPTAGYVYSSFLQNASSNGCYWSNTAYDPIQAYYLYFDSGNVITHNGGRSYGFSIRCIAP